MKVPFRPEEEELEDEEEQITTKENDGISLTEKMQLWNTAKPDAEKPDGTIFDQLDIAEVDEDDDYVITHFAEAWAFLTNGHAYRWLLGRVRTELLLTERDGTSAETIRREILRGLAYIPKGHGYGQAVSKAKFVICWSLSEFLKEQYPEELDPQLGSLITIVGSGDDVQALTCSQYMSQVWPVTGLETLDALQEAFKKESGQIYEGK